MRDRADGIRRIVSFPARRPWLALGVALVLAGVSFFAVSRLRADTTLEGLFPRNDPAGMAMLRVLKKFSAAEELIVMATDEGKQPDVQKLIAFAQRLDRAIEKSKDTSRLVGGVSYRADEKTQAFFKEVLVPNGLFYLDDAAFAQAKKRLSRAEMEKQFRQDEALVAAPGPAAQALAKAFLQDPLRLHEFIIQRLAGARPFQTMGGTDAFVSPDGRTILVRIRGRRPPSDVAFSKLLVSDVGRIAKSVNSDGLKVELTGSYAIAAAAEAGIRRDMISTVVGSVVLLQLLFVVAYRRPLRVFVLAFGPVALGVLYGFGVYAGVLPTLTPMSAVIGGILAGMGIDYSIQYLAHYEDFRLGGQEPREAAAVTTVRVGPAIFAAFFTSAIGFVAIGWSKVPALVDFAVLGTLGLAGAFVGTLLVLPALLVLSDRSDGNELANRVRVEGMLRGLSRWRRVAIGAALIVLLLAGAELGVQRDWFRLESDLTVMHPRPNAALDAQRKLAEKFGGSPGSFIVDLRAKTPEELVELSHRVEKRLERAPVREAGITGSFGLATLLPDPAVAPKRVAETGPALAKKVVSDFQAVVNESVFNEKSFEPYEGFLEHLLTRTEAPGVKELLSYPSLAETVLPKDAARDSLPTESITLISVRGNLDDRAVRDRAISAVEEAITDLPGATLTGMSVLARSAEMTIRHDLPRMVAIAVLIVAAYLALHFRNLTAMGLALVPTIFGLVTLLAFMRVTDERLNMVNLAALPLLIGIDVDYGIFLVHLARQRRDAVRQNPEAIGPAVRAVILCAASMIFGFVSLVTTSVPAIRSLGVAMAIGVTMALVGTILWLLPMLLVRREN